MLSNFNTIFRFIPHKNEKGASFIELAIALPLLVIFVAGIIDYALAIRQLNNLSTVTRSAARTAAKHTANTFITGTADPTVPCHGVPALQCHNQTNMAVGARRSVEEAAWVTACNSLNKMGIASNFSVETTLEEASFHPNPLKVIVHLKLNTANPLTDRYCLVCADTFIPALRAANIQIRSSFLLDNECTGFTP